MNIAKILLNGNLQFDSFLPLTANAPCTVIRSNKLAITVFDTCDEIVTRCCDAWNFFASDSDVLKSIESRDYAKMLNL